MILKKRVHAIAIFTLAFFICFTLCLENTYSQDNSPQVKAEKSQQQSSSNNNENKDVSSISKMENNKIETLEPGVQEKENPTPQMKKKKKFPWLWVILGIGVVAGLILLLTKKKKPTLILTVTVGEGVNGYPLSGSYTYKMEEFPIPYSYSLSTNDYKYKELTVLFDGEESPASGNLSITGPHSLSVSATKLNATYTNGVLTVNDVRYELVSIPAGEFQMGSDNTSYGGVDIRPVHSVRISKSFWLGKTEVTQGLWKALMGDNPSHFKNGDNYPVDSLSWNDCQSFITKLNQLIVGNYFRLPTEAEWEYACRAGTTGDRYGNIDLIAWYSNNSGLSTHSICQKQANSWNLYDMLGNVSEWCYDWYGKYTNSYQVDPTGPSTGSERIMRGGTYGSSENFVWSAHRNWGNPNNGSGHYSNGFRLAANSAEN